MSYPVRAPDMSGRTFGRLTARERGPNNSKRGAQWWCDCSCGGRTLASACNLRSGKTRSCGCLSKGQAI